MANELSQLTLEHKVLLLRIARETIYHFISRSKAPESPDDDPRLLADQGVFVSLHIDGRLRGCMGTLAGDGSLLKTVVNMALCAATEDPRFAPLRMDELPATDIELSVLGPLSPTNVSEIEVGVHGLFVTKGRVRGTLLPQVATQYNWNSEEFIGQTCVKAGLERDAWKGEDCRIEAFTAEVFSESGLRDH
jgi:AmmeMemoRadiSam system protein A